MCTVQGHFCHLEKDQLVSLEQRNPKASISTHESLKISIELGLILRYHNQEQLYTKLESERRKLDQ